MYKKFAFVFLAFTFIAISITEAKGGRGGRSSGGRRGSISSRSFSGSHTSQQPSGGWIHGFFHIPHHYTYTPTHTSGISRSSYHIPTEEENGQNQDDDNYAVGYAISRSLGNNFFPIFGMVNDISKIPDRIRNKEFSTTTSTVGPVSTYNMNDIINNPYATTSNPIIESDQMPWNPDSDIFAGGDNSQKKQIADMEMVLSALEDLVETNRSGISEEQIVNDSFRKLFAVQR